MNAQNVAGRLTQEETPSLAALLHKLLPKMTVAALSLLMNRAVLPGGYFPFGAAFIAAVPEAYATIAAVGGIIGCLTDGGLLLSLEGLRHVASLLAVGGIRWALGEWRPVSRAKYYPFFTALAGVVLTGSVINGTTGALLSYSTLYFLFEGLMAGMAAMVFAGAADALALFDGAKRLAGSTSASLLLTFCAAVIPLCRVEVLHLSPALILVQTAVLLVLPYHRETGGAVGGTAAGCLTALANGSLYQGTVCPVAALLAGYAARYGRVFAASVYIAACLTGTLASGSMDYSFAAEAATAGVLSCLIPTEWTERALTAAGWMRDNRSAARVSYENGAAVKRLRQSAAALSKVCGMTEQVSEKLEKRGNCHPEAEVCRQAVQKVCAKCPCRESCCGRREEGEQNRIRRLAEGMSGRGLVSGRDISHMLGVKCIHEEALLGEMRENRGYRLAAEGARRRQAQMRAAFGDQWKVMGLLLRALGDELEAGDRSRFYGAGEASQLTRALEEGGYEVLQAACGEDRGERTVVALTLRETDSTVLSRGDIQPYVEECLGCRMEAPAISDEADGAFRVTLTERPRYRLDFASAQHCCNNGKYCGDACECLEDGAGSGYLLLSDGMGSGGRAAVDGAMACGIFAELMKGGFGCESAAKLVNAALMMKSEDESLSTIDCLQIHLCNGRARFCKAGAAQSYHVRGGVVNRIDAPSLPLGILHEVDASQYCFTAEAGDLLVMLSDGVPTDESGWFEKLLAQYDGGSVQRFAEFLLRRAAGRRPVGDDDDITVMVCAVRDDVEGEKC